MSKSTTESEWLDFDWLIIYKCAVVFIAVAGPKEAQGHTPNLAISSHNDNMLFTADGEQAVIGPDKLRITGKPTAATCRRRGNIASLWAKKR